MSLTEADIAGMKVADLRKQLSSRSLSIKGVKKILAARLLTAVKAEQAEAAEEEAAAAAEEEAKAAEATEAAEAEAAEVAEEAEVAAEVAEEEEAEEAEEAEVAAVSEEAEEVAAVVAEEVVEPVEPVAPPTYVAQDTILAKLDAKDEAELTTIEKDILAARERNDKFSAEEGEKKAFQISDDLRKKMRAQRFGPITTPALSGRKRSRPSNEEEGAKKAKISTDVVVDDDELKKRKDRSERFFTGQPGESVTSNEATGQPEIATEVTEETVATEVTEE